MTAVYAFVRVFSEAAKEFGFSPSTFYRRAKEIKSSDLRKAYHEKVTLYHPDKVNSLGEKLKIVAEEEMKNINDAYSFLSRFSK